jgi:SAM-dependent methyltransferase
MTGQVETVLERLRGLSLEDFGRVMVSMPDPAWPALSRVLPRMADEQVQKDWTGNSGLPLLQQTLAFVRSVESHFVRVTGRPLQGSDILDYGCGYGRILRLMYYFTPPSGTVGVDPWDRSIGICQEDGIPSALAVSEYLPAELPVGDRQFDLMYAFSVFTHTSERATRMALRTLRRYAKPDGMLTITVRPRNYWETVAASDKTKDTTAMLAAHDRAGFAFAPHNRAPVDGDITYGDTSISLDWLTEHAEGWRIAGVDHTENDPLQSIVYLVPT